jgi:hypothetical protein
MERQLFFVSSVFFVCILFVEGQRVLKNEVVGGSDRLMVTPYLTRGEVEKAQNLSRVTNFTRVHSYSGFFNVHPTYNSNMFFWFFPAAVNFPQ